MPATTQPTLSRTEWQAVSIALGDAASCSAVARGEPGLLSRLYTLVTGNAPRRPLADARLEAIRGFVCDTRRHRAPAEGRIPALEAQGFSRAQVEALALLSV